MGEKACNLVDIDTNIVKSGCLSSHLQRLFVEVKSSRKVFPLQEIIGLVLVLGECELVELLLDDLECVGRLRVLRVNNQDPVEVSLAFLIVLQSVV